MPDTAIYLST